MRKLGQGSTATSRAEAASAGHLLWPRARGAWGLHGSSEVHSRAGAQHPASRPPAGTRRSDPSAERASRDTPALLAAWSGHRQARALMSPHGFSRLAPLLKAVSRLLSPVRHRVQVDATCPVLPDPHSAQHDRQLLRALVPGWEMTHRADGQEPLVSSRPCPSV